MAKHTLGGKVRIELDTGGPTANDLVLKWRAWPSGEEQTVQGGSIVSDGGGLYHAEIVPTVEGHHRWRWTSDTLDLAAEGSFDVVSDYLGG
jgi:hypothetical protein